MIQAIFLLPRRARHPEETVAEPSIARAPRIAQARALHHEVVRRGPYPECQRCAQFWLCKKDDILSELGPCPGHIVYGKPERDRPWIIPTEGNLTGGVSKRYTSPIALSGSEESCTVQSVEPTQRVATPFVDYEIRVGQTPIVNISCRLGSTMVN